MKLKQYTLTAPLNIVDGTKKVATIYDAISAIIFVKYFAANKLTIKSGTRKIDNYHQLKLIYGDINTLSDVVK